MREIIDGHTIDLGDDGTLDTTLIVDGVYRVTFSQEFVADYRLDDGSFSKRGFRNLANEALEEFLSDLDPANDLG